MLRPQKLGLGPNRVQAVALFANGEQVFGAPQVIELRRPPPPTITFQQSSDAKVIPTMQSDSELVTWDWFQAVGSHVTGSVDALTRAKNRSVLEASKKLALCRMDLDRTAADWQQVRSEVVLPVPSRGTLAGLAFNIKKKNHFDFFGLHGGESGWVFGTYRKGNLKIHQNVGRRIPYKKWIDVHVRQTADGLEGMVDGYVLCTWPGPPSESDPSVCSQKKAVWSSAIGWCRRPRPRMRPRKTSPASHGTGLRLYTSSRRPCRYAGETTNSRTTKLRKTSTHSSMELPNESTTTAGASGGS